MALIGNFSVLNKSAARWRCGGATGQGLSRVDYYNNGKKRNIYVGWAGIDPKSSFPSGYSVHRCGMTPAQKSGGMASSTLTYGSGDIPNFNLAGGRNAEAAITGEGDITNAALALILSAVASITGTSSFTGDVFAELNGAATLAGSGDLDGAIKAIGHAAVLLAGTGTIPSSSSLKAKANISADIVVTGELLNSANISDALLDAVDGVEAGLTLRQALRLIAAASAGKVSGAAGTTITIRNAIADSKNRIVADVDADGNRTAITTDLD